MSNSLHATNNFYKDTFISVLMRGIKVYNHAMTVLLEYIDCSLKFSTNAYYCCSYLHFPIMHA